MTAHPTATTVRSGSMAECLSAPARGGVAVETVGAAAVTVTDAAATDAVATDAAAMDAAAMDAAVEVGSMVEAAIAAQAVASTVAVDTVEAASTVVVDTAAADTAVVDTAAAATAVDTGKALRVGSVSTAGSTALPAVFLWFCLTPHTSQSPAQSPVGTPRKTSCTA
jgi:hypothetical protein